MCNQETPLSDSFEVAPLLTYRVSANIWQFYYHKVNNNGFTVIILIQWIPNFKFPLCLILYPVIIKMITVTTKTSLSIRQQPVDIWGGGRCFDKTQNMFRIYWYFKTLLSVTWNPNHLFHILSCIQIAWNPDFIKMIIYHNWNIPYPNYYFFQVKVNPNCFIRNSLAPHHKINRLQPYNYMMINVMKSIQDIPKIFSFR